MRPQFRRHYCQCLTSSISWFLIKLTVLPEVFHLPAEGSARQPRAAGNSKCRPVPPCLEALRGQTALGCSLLSSPFLHCTPHKRGHPAASPGHQQWLRWIRGCWVWDSWFLSSNFTHQLFASEKSSQCTHFIISFSIFCCHFIVSWLVTTVIKLL